MPLTSREKHTRLQAMIDQKEKAAAEAKQLAEQENKAKHESDIRARALAEIKAKQEAAAKKKADQEAAAKEKAEREVSAKADTESLSFSGIKIDLPGMDRISSNLGVLADVTEKLITTITTSNKATISSITSSIESNKPDLSPIRDEVLNLIAAQNRRIEAQEKQIAEQATMISELTNSSRRSLPLLLLPPSHQATGPSSK